MTKGWATAALSIAALCVATGSGATETACAPSSTIILTSGSSVCGVAAARQNVFSCKGFAHATAERWEAPKPALWPPTHPIQAVAFGPICPQDSPPRDMAEGCLSLNIWAPQDAINGGAFVKGFGSSALYDGSALAARGAVVVTFNYRLARSAFFPPMRSARARSAAISASWISRRRWVGSSAIFRSSAAIRSE
jgi:carboxylesterase type B